MNINQSLTDALPGEPTSSPLAQNGTFDAWTISVIRSEHAKLLSLFSNLEKIAGSQPKLIVADLILLRELFQQQRSKEKLLFRSYLDRILVHHTSLLEEAIDVWKRVEEIATSVDQFIADWIACPPVTHMLPVFLDQLQRTTKAWMAHTDLQEGTLHGLYSKTL